MKETKLQSHELDVIQANTGLQLYLSGLSTGKSATPRSSLYNISGKTEMLKPDEILARWKRQLSKLQQGSSFEQEVFQFDSAQESKWGPQGGVPPIDELLETIVFPTFEQKETPTAFSSVEWSKAKRIVARNLHSCGCVGLSPVPYRRVVDDMRARDTLESNSGWPLFTRRSDPSVIKQSIEEAENGQWKTYPAIALFRNYNRKTRLVWMFPMSANLVEGSFFQPLQSILMRSRFSRSFLAPWKGFEQVRENISVAYSKRKVVAASDFSATDEHFVRDSSLEVLTVLETCFQPRFRSALRESIEHMHEIPLVISDTTKLEGVHGVSSGSNWTNFIETIFDWIFSEYVRLKESGKYNVQGMYAIGDDMSWLFEQHQPDFATVLADYGNEVGQEIKAEKTTNYPDKVKSLQRLFQAGYLREDHLIRAVYPTIRALKSLVYPERMHKKKQWSKDMSAVRAFMILENTVDHPLFFAFCKFVSEGDPYLRDFARKPAIYQNAQYRKSKLIPGLNATYNQERRNSKLSEFASVRYIATL